MAPRLMKGLELLRDPLLNKGPAFTPEEREKFELYGFLPCNIEHIEEQLLRCRDAYNAKTTPLERHIYLRALQDRNEVLFYRFVNDNLEELLPIIYTPVVGEACQLFHHIYRQARGLFICYPERDKMDNILSHIEKTRKIRVIVVTDGERILGLGDQGVGGLGIPIGKLSLYTACGGIDPKATLPIVLDVGTNNQERLDDPEYLGWRHTRIIGKEYDDFVELFVQSVKRHFPHVLLQFEDFAQNHAYPLLERYQNQLCAFNDDIQGTAAVVVAAILAATRAASLDFKDQRVALLGAGSAGCGISQQLVRVMISQGLSEAEAYERFFLVDRNGLLLEDMPDLQPFQRPFAHAKSRVQHWKLEHPGKISLRDVIENAKPTILLGVSGQPNQFTEPMVRTMLGYCKRPVIFPLSNPTSREEAKPEDLLHWSHGTALVATGSPFSPVTINSRKIVVSQCNNSYIFPGVGLGVVAGNIRRVTDSMMMAAAVALSEFVTRDELAEGRLLPEITKIREVSQHIAKAVIIQAIKENHAASTDEKALVSSIKKTMWEPVYPTN